MTYPKRIRIVEVGPRDGLQNEAAIVPPQVRAELIGQLANAGLTTIEVGSFVSSRWVPRMAGTSEVVALLANRPGVSYQALVPNERGMAAAFAAGIREISVFAAASEAFSMKNINCSVDESLRRFEPVLAGAAAHGMKVRGYVSCALGCPYQGTVPLADVARVAGLLYDMGCGEISLGDTIGVGTPLAALRMAEAVVARVPAENLALHFHDTYGQALANILACLQTGITVIDAAVGGLGGCPYADGAAGNVATEDLVYMLHGMGIETGIDLPRLVEVAWYISTALGRPPQSRLAKALRRE